uniref:Macrophage stimulating 1 n=1 Tax=Callorhinchus milii TaxID=7868 RepID=A0A4W3GEY2_CALMI
MAGHFPGQRSPLNDYHRSRGVQLQTLHRSPEGHVSGAEECAIRCTDDLRCRAFNYNLQAKDCQILSSTSQMEGTERHKHIHIDLYEKKAYVRECIVNNGATYRGTVSVTQSGKTCQEWISNFPEKGLDMNYCRNPDNDVNGPWCYTTDWTTRIEACGIKRCENDICVLCNGEDYNGFVDRTESGRECQRWDLNSPHRHNYQPDKYRDMNLDDNYCRNPDGSPQPWCFTTDPNVEREFCNIQRCGKSSEKKDECFKRHGIGYRGTVNKTTSGTPCQPWNSQVPHQHQLTPENYPCKGLEENYCRNPDGSEAPWCFTSDPDVRHAFCLQIDRCEDDIEPEDCYYGNGEMYRGSVKKTRKGIHFPQSHFTVTSIPSHPKANLVGNLCRNPDGDSHGPWCYTMHPKVQWDYCAINTCRAHEPPIVDPEEVVFDSCGKRDDRMFRNNMLRIVGGLPGNSPWTISLRNRAGKHFCGGTLVSTSWIISSKQCFSSCYVERRGYEAWMGTIFKDPRPNDPNKQAIPIQRAVCGPSSSNLIMLQLERPASLNERVAVICLPPPQYIVPEGTGCEIAGWGETQGTGDDEVLNILQMPVMSNRQCNGYHRGLVQPTEICAGAISRAAGACEKDYGGPLACFTNECWVLEGVIIPGRGCGRRNRPGIFIRVSMYVDWMNKVMKMN